MSNIIIQSEYERRQAICALGALNLDKPWIVSIKKKTKRRSLSQNSLMWKWIGEVVKHVKHHTGYESDEIHEFFKQKFLTARVVKIGNEEKLYRTTTKLSTAEMTEYMNAIYRWATSELGLILPIPEELHQRL